MEQPPIIPVDYYRYLTIAVGVYLLWSYLITVIIITLLPISAYYGYLYYLRSTNKNRIDVKNKAVFITGCDTGFGHDLAILNNDQGFVVFAGCLNADGTGAKDLKSRSSDAINIVPLDVTSDQSVEDALKTVEEACKDRKLELWGVVNNAGINFIGPIELISMEEFHRTCDINLFGSVRVTKAFLPLLRQFKGRVVNITSERARLFRSLSSAYCMSKYGLTAFTDSVRLEMNRFGIKTVLIEPGHFGHATAIIENKLVEYNVKKLHEELENSSDDVRATYSKYDIDSIFGRTFFNTEGPWSSYPNTQPVINCIANCLVDPVPRERYIVGGTKNWYDPRTVCTILKSLLPDTLMDMVIDYYF